RMLRVRGLIHPTSAVCATTDTARGEKRLPSEQNQAILKSSGRPLGECRIKGLVVGTVNIWEVPGYRIEMSPFGGIKDSGNGYKEGVIEAMKSFTNIKTFSLPWT
ncbi:aldehyde dehydrogenase family protein, partial [Paragemmobacter kunshanensis]|uniref:aldehyde dehydrogenase family protein n=1 Tax=Paragemmobacter kunshanensis TaxID=2583234 RepID=UPI0019D17AB6